MPPVLKCAVYLPNFGAFGSARTLAQLGTEAEAAGWDGFFIWDHIARPFAIDMVDPWVALAAIALSTTTIRIGALVTPLPRRRPWKLARETSSIDHLSGGRLVVGVGSGSPGGRAVEWGSLGEEMDSKARGAMVDEGLAVLTGLWSGQPFTFDGAYYRVTGAQFLPPPLQSPRIPIWIAGNWPNRPPMRRAARWDGVFPWFGREGESIGQLKAVIDYTRSYRASEQSFDVVYPTAPLARHDRAAAAAALNSFAEAGATWWLERIEPGYFGGTWQGPWPFEAMRDHIRSGPPRE